MSYCFLFFCFTGSSCRSESDVTTEDMAKKRFSQTTGFSQFSVGHKAFRLQRVQEKLDRLLITTSRRALALAVTF